MIVRERTTHYLMAAYGVMACYKTARISFVAITNSIISIAKL